MLSTNDEVIEIVILQMSTAADALSSDGMNSAVDTALAELKWTLPISDSVKSFWLIKRSVRHACFILWVASAQKFKYKQVNLNQRFEHYEKLIAMMDKEFEVAMTNDTALFAGVEPYKLFGMAISAGFIYDGIGQDLTYSDMTRFLSGEV
jgi:hypothetical protein